MAFSLNKIMLIGNIGKDAETRFTPNNASVTSFSIATTHGYKNKDGQWTNETTWHNVVAFNLSDFVKEKLVKGKKIYVEGRLSKRDYEKDGVKQYFTEVVTDSSGIILLEGKDDNYNPGNNTSQVAETSSDIGGSTEENNDLPF
ncbi:MAG: single-stranded DNA-binding protein [Ignavibacteria bacterium]|nr:single-stranded DNA-binding protein [Ignavibacteria bacterium]